MDYVICYVYRWMLKLKMEVRKGKGYVQYSYDEGKNWTREIYKKNSLVGIGRFMYEHAVDEVK